MQDTVVVDSGPCIALFDRDDEYHQAAIDFVKHTPARLVSTLAVVTEVMYVLDFSLRAQLDFLAWVDAGALILMEPAREDLDRVVELMQKYSDLPMDFTDGLLVATCERLGVRRIATVDDDFTVYRYKNRSTFTNVLKTD